MSHEIRGSEQPGGLNDAAWRAPRTPVLLGLLYVAGFGEVYPRIFWSGQFGRPGHSYVLPPYAYYEVPGAPFRTNGF